MSRRLSGRENRFVLNRLHTISRGIVAEALRYDCSHIAVEDMAHVGEQMDAHDDQLKRQLHNWAFRELQEQIQ